MADYDNTNSGTFFVNDRKEKENHPDYNGKINVEGKEYYLKGWKKVAKSGVNFLSLAVNPVDGAQWKSNTFWSLPPIRTPTILVVRPAITPSLTSTKAPSSAFIP